MEDDQGLEEEMGMERNELLVVAQIIEEVRDTLRMEMAQMRADVGADLGAVVEQVFGDAYEREVMGHYKRFLIAECARVGVGVGEYAKVVKAVTAAQGEAGAEGDGAEGEGDAG